MEEFSNERVKFIISEITKGNYELFGEFIRAYQSSLYGFIYRIVRNRDDAMDLTQETFFKAYRSIRSFKFRSKFSTWLFQIGYHEAINFIKKYSRRREIEISITAKFKPDDSSVYTLENELNEKIEKALYELKKEQRVALHLLYKEEKSYKEIAKIMEIPINTVKSHIRRGKDILKQNLSEIYDQNIILA